MTPEQISNQLDILEATLHSGLQMVRKLRKELCNELPGKKAKKGVLTPEQSAKITAHRRKSLIKKSR